MTVHKRVSLPVNVPMMCGQQDPELNSKELFVPLAGLAFIQKRHTVE